jgi:hypothetical protein
MTLDEARTIIDTQDLSDLPKALNAMAVVLRFHGISDRRLLDVARQIEEAAALGAHPEKKPL